ncbi:MAG: glycosyltransferase [Rhodanobacteraceae bacterium]|nr:glycosyltransferase [Rhodanobacteraceae bacterium]
MRSPRVTVYVTCRNYGKYLRECLNSVVSQAFTDWELIVFNEASTDDTGNILAEYAAILGSKMSVRTNQAAMGLRWCANHALDMGRGEFIMRLDADDYLDESALLVMVAYLDSHREVGLVFPNWTFVGESGEFLGIERRKAIGRETHALDLPAHGACTMVRMRVLKTIGGYDPEFSAQDGHELWMKALHRFKVANIQTPLFFYRQHSNSMSRDEELLLSARRKIKRALIDQRQGATRPKILGVIPAKNTYARMQNVVLRPLGQVPLLAHSLNAALDSGVFDRIVVSTDDEEVIGYCQSRTGVDVMLRKPELSGGRVKLSEVVFDCVSRFEFEGNWYPDIVVILSVHTPLRRDSHIREVVDTLLIYDVDQVISTYEDMDLHFKHGMNGLETINPGVLESLRYEREALYVYNGAVHGFWREFLRKDSLYHGRIGHIQMSRRESIQIKSDEDFELVGRLLEGTL